MSDDIGIRVIAQIDKIKSEQTIQKSINEMSKNIKITLELDTSKLTAQLAEVKKKIDSVKAGSKDVISSATTSKNSNDLSEKISLYQTGKYNQLDSFQTNLTDMQKRNQVLSWQVEIVDKLIAGYDGTANAAKNVNNEWAEMERMAKGATIYEQRQQEVEHLISSNKELFATNPELQKMASDFETLNKNVLAGQGSAKQLGLSFTSLKNKVAEAKGETGGFGEVLKKAFSYFGAYRIASDMIRLMGQSLKEAIQYVTEMDSTMTEFRYVTGMSKNQVDSLRSSFTDLGEQVGATTEEVANGALEWVNILSSSL